MAIFESKCINWSRLRSLSIFLIVGLLGTYLILKLLAGGVVNRLDQQDSFSKFNVISSNQTSKIWQPEPSTTFQWQLSGSPDLSIAADVYDLDGFDTDPDTIKTLHEQGHRAIGYVSMGTWESWRSDQSRFPKQVIGKDYQDWASEKWLDIRRIDALAPILRARLDMLKAKGFDAIEPDNIDGYEANTGFLLTEEEQFRFNTWLAHEAHMRGLSIGLKNDSKQAQALQPYFDWALTEDAFVQGWASVMTEFINAKKAVFMTEYTGTGVTLRQFCPAAKSLGFTGILKHRNLDAWRESCSA